MLHKYTVYKLKFRIITYPLLKDNTGLVNILISQQKQLDHSSIYSDQNTNLLKAGGKKFKVNIHWPVVHGLFKPF